MGKGKARERLINASALGRTRTNAKTRDSLPRRSSLETIGVRLVIARFWALVGSVKGTGGTVDGSAEDES